MTTYVLPRLKVHQEFAPILNGQSDPLNACIIAPHYGLHRFDVAEEKEELGSYDPTTNNVFNEYPNKSAGSVINVDSNKVYLEDAVMQYNQFISTGLTEDGGNKIKEDSLVFKTANGVNRSAVYGTRDVAIGDYVLAQWGSNSIETTVAGLIENDVSAVVESLTASNSNQGNTTVSAGSSAESITPSDVSITNVDATSYDGLESGHVSETYVCTVIEAGALGLAKISITSISGTDEVAEQLVSTSGNPTACGTRGATFTLTDDDNSGDELQIGDTWTVSAVQDYTKPVPISSGNYSGPSDTTYVIRIRQGGVIGTDNILFDVYSIDGIDQAPEKLVTIEGTYLVGNYGVEVTFNDNEQYVAGDEFLIQVTAEAKGAVKTIALAVNLVGAVTTDSITVTLGLKDTIQLGKGHWTADEANITVFGGADHIGSYLGTEDNFNILSGTICIEYKELLVEKATSIHGINMLSEVSDTLGPATLDNPLSLMVSKALENSEGITVYYIALTEDTLEGYQEALDITTDSTVTYSMVPYSTKRSVKDAFEAHVNEMSTPEIGDWRIAWLGVDVDKTQTVYDKLADGSSILATVNGTLNKTVTSANALFMTNNVTPGDTLRIQYSTDAFGEESYDSYVIDTVDSESQLTLLRGLDAPIGTAIRVEIWKDLTKTEWAKAIALDSAHFNNRRVRNVFAGKLSTATDENVPSSVLAAALAGLRSGVAPHQPITNVEISGFTIDTNIGLSTTNLNTMAGYGTWIVTQDLDGFVFTRHQVTTNNDDINMREDTITTNLDHISRDFRNQMGDLHGRGNVSPQMVSLIRFRITEIKFAISNRIYPDEIGPQLLDMEIVKLATNELLRDHIDIELEPVLPYPLNNLNIYLRIK